jgi:hypothetical protein
MATPPVPDATSGSPPSDGYNTNASEKQQSHHDNDKALYEKVKSKLEGQLEPKFWTRLNGEPDDQAQAQAGLDETAQGLSDNKGRLLTTIFRRRTKKSPQSTV